MACLEKEMVAAKGRGSWAKKMFRNIEGKAFTAFEERDRAAIVAAEARAKVKEMAKSNSAAGNRERADTGGVTDVTALGHSSSAPGLFKPIHFLQRGFGLGERPDILPSADNSIGPGQYDVLEVGSIKWGKEQGNSFPAQCSIAGHKSCKVAGMGKPKIWTGSGVPPLARAPGPGHYAVPNYWDPNWQQYPTKGKSMVRFGNVPLGCAPPAPESRFGGLARQELGNSKGDMGFLQ